MFAYARVALGAQVPQVEQSGRDLSQFEHVTLEGSGETWEAARQTVAILEGAVVLAWARWPL